MVSIPRVVIAAPASGHGKTSVATGLLAAFAARGVAVSPHKVGPDYIDPGYHALAAGRVGRNLDPWLVGEERILPLFRHGSQGADLAIVEGVMGLFDGAAGQGGFASTAHVAGILKAPVLLVVDCSSQSRSLAALLHGFTTFDPAVQVGGVILNRVGSPRHQELLRSAAAEVGVPVLGSIGRHEALSTPSRHLGLIPAAERSVQAQATVAALRDVVLSSVDLDAVFALARSAPDISGLTWNPSDEIGAPPPRAPRIAVAAGAAFTFSYNENVELLTAAGAEVVAFDPLFDANLPDGTAGLVIGGGFPEIHAAGLSENAQLRKEIHALALSGAPIVAECAGLLYLARSLDGAPMCGVLDTDAAMGPRLTLGYREAVAVTNSVVADRGTRIHGHEFHRTLCSPMAGPAGAWQWAGSDGPTGFVQGGVHASYLHLNWAGSPSFASRIVASALAVSAPSE
jgi:cobyrinic acid a,c-diamide synthase